MQQILQQFLIEPQTKIASLLKYVSQYAQEARQYAGTLRAIHYTLWPNTSELIFAEGELVSISALTFSLYCGLSEEPSGEQLETPPFQQGFPTLPIPDVFLHPEDNDTPIPYLSLRSTLDLLKGLEFLISSGTQPVDAGAALRLARALEVRCAFFTRHSLGEDVLNLPDMVAQEDRVAARPIEKPIKRIRLLFDEEEDSEGAVCMVNMRYAMTCDSLFASIYQALFQHKEVSPAVLPPPANHLAAAREWVLVEGCKMPHAWLQEVWGKFADRFFISEAQCRLFRLYTQDIARFKPSQVRLFYGFGLFASCPADFSAKHVEFGGSQWDADVLFYAAIQAHAPVIDLLLHKGVLSFDSVGKRWRVQKMCSFVSLMEAFVAWRLDTHLTTFILGEVNVAQFDRAFKIVS